MMPLALSPATAALAVSLALNAALGGLWLAARDDVAESRARIDAARVERDAALDAGQACTAAVAELQALAETRAKQAAQARREAQAKARKHAARADAVLAAPPAVPGDDCARARARVGDWLKGRP